MSSPQAMPQHAPNQPFQVHPIAELRETAFQLGIIRNRNLVLATENYALQERVTQLEGEVEALTAPTSNAPANKDGAA